MSYKLNKEEILFLKHVNFIFEISYFRVYWYKICKIFRKLKTNYIKHGLCHSFSLWSILNLRIWFSNFKIQQVRCLSLSFSPGNAHHPPSVVCFCLCLCQESAPLSFAAAVVAIDSLCAATRTQLPFTCRRIQVPACPGVVEADQTVSRRRSALRAYVSYGCVCVCVCESLRWCWCRESVSAKKITQRVIVKDRNAHTLTRPAMKIK